jgi:phosphate butyryltransferase
MQETLDAAMLVKMSERGQTGTVIVDGPLAIDCVLSKESAKLKGIETTMSEEADILLMPDIASGNIAIKALIYLAKAKVGGIIVGAKAPIVLLSRSDTAEIKLISIALASVI